jgi:transposase
MHELDSKLNRVVIDARKFGPKAQKAKRERAFEMRKKGISPMVIAKDEKVGVHVRTVQHWFAQADKGEEEDVVIQGGKRGATVGDNRVLSAEQEREIVGHITTQLPGPQFRLWCVDALLELIRDRFMMDISRGSVGNYLMRWGIDPPAPSKPPQTTYAYQRVRERALKEKALMFWAGEMTPAFCSEPAGKLTDGDIPMLYARIGKGQIFFMFETEELRESRMLWARFAEELGMIASARKAPRKAFVLVPHPQGMNKELSALYSFKLDRTPRSFEIFYISTGWGG